MLLPKLKRYDKKFDYSYTYGTFPTIDLIKFKNRVESGRAAIPHSGKSQPRKIPSTNPIIIFHVSEIFGSFINFRILL